MSITFDEAPVASSQLALSDNSWLRYITFAALYMAQGIPENTSPLIEFDLAGPTNGKRGYYDWDKNNFAPRISAAWTPTDRLVVRGGYALVYDRIGLALAQNFDANGSWGLSTSIDSAYAGYGETVVLDRKRLRVPRYGADLMSLGEGLSGQQFANWTVGAEDHELHATCCA